MPPIAASWNHLPARTTLYYTSMPVSCRRRCRLQRQPRAAAATILAHVTSVTGILRAGGQRHQADFHFAATDVAGASTQDRDRWGYCTDRATCSPRIAPRRTF
jgi:hypothetical protein